MDDLADLYARYHDDVRRFALFLTGDPTRADDLTSETFVRAWAARGRIAAPSVRSYLLTITRNLHRDDWRRTRRFVALETTIVDPSAPLDDRVHHVVRLTGVRSALKGLAPGDRRALLLHAASGLTYAQTARRLGITLAAVKSRIFRARAALASALSSRSGGSL